MPYLVYFEGNMINVSMSHNRKWSFISMLQMVN